MDRVVAETSRDAILGAVSDDDVVALLTERIMAGADINSVGALAAENRPAVNSRVAVIVAIQRYGGSGWIGPEQAVFASVRISHAGKKELANIEEEGSAVCRGEGE